MELLSRREKSRSSTATLLRRIHNEHKMVIEQQLASGSAARHRLWLAVGYFLEGSGRHVDRSFANREQWEQLRKDTGRS